MLSRDHNRGSSGHSRWKTLLNEFVPWNPGQSLVRSNIFIQEWFSKIPTRWKETAIHRRRDQPNCCLFLRQLLMKSSLKAFLSHLDIPCSLRGEVINPFYTDYNETSRIILGRKMDLLKFWTNSKFVHRILRRKEKSFFEEETLDTLFSRFTSNYRMKSHTWISF